jgi:hypothetical protein
MSLAREGFQNLVGQRLEKRIGNREFAEFRLARAKPRFANTLPAK